MSHNHVEEEIDRLIAIGEEEIDRLVAIQEAQTLLLIEILEILRMPAQKVSIGVPANVVATVGTATPIN